MAGPTIRLTFAGDSRDLERSMGRVEDAAGQMERTFSVKSLAMGAAGAAAGAGLVDAFTDSLEFESARAKLQAQMGNSEYAEAAGRVAGELYADAYGDSLEEVGAATRAVLGAGLAGADASDEQIRTLTASTISLAEAFDQDVSGAAAAAGQMMKTGLAPDAQTALDILTVGFQNGADKAGDLLDTFNEYGTQFRKVGLDGQTAMGLISQGLQAGARDADLVADSIKEFSIRAIDGSKSTAEGFQAIGLNAEEMAAKIAAGGPEATAALDTTLDRLRAMEDPVARDAAAVQLFGTQAEDLGAALYALDPSEAATKLGDFKGAAEGVNDTLRDTAENKITEVKRGFDDWMMSIVGVEGPLGNVAAAAVGMGGDVVSTVGSLGMAAMALRGLGVATGIQTAAQWLLNAAMRANPMMLVVTAIGLLVGALIYAWNNSETFRNIVLGVWEAVKTGISTAVDWVVDAISWFSNLPGMVSQWFHNLKEAAIRKAIDLVNWLRGLPGRIMSAIGNLGSLLLNAGRDLLTGLWNGISGAIGWLKSKISGFFGSLLPGWVRDMLGIRSPSKVFADIGQHLPTGLAQGMDSNLGAVADAAGRMATVAVAGVSSGMRSAMAEIADRIRSGGQIYEDMSWRGMSANASRYNDDIVRAFQAAGGGNRNDMLRWLTSQSSRPSGPTQAQVTFSGNTSDALASTIMQMFRTGQIQIRAGVA